MPGLDGRIRVFLCDDVEAFRVLMRFALEEDPGIEVVGEAADGAAGVEGVADTQPDVVLLDLAMPRLDGLEALPRMLAAAPRVQIVALSGFAADGMERRTLEQGAFAYLEKGADLDAINAAVRAAARG